MVVVDDFRGIEQRHGQRLAFGAHAGHGEHGQRMVVAPLAPGSVAQDIVRPCGRLPPGNHMLPAHGANLGHGAGNAENPGPTILVGGVGICDRAWSRRLGRFPAHLVS